MYAEVLSIALEKRFSCLLHRSGVGLGTDFHKSYFPLKKLSAPLNLDTKTMDRSKRASKSEIAKLSSLR